MKFYIFEFSKKIYWEFNFHEDLKKMTCILHENVCGNISLDSLQGENYSVIQKDGLNFVLLYFLNYTWYMNDLHNI